MRALKSIFILLSFAGMQLQLSAQGEPFSKRTVISGLNSAWEITYGPNDSLWITENVKYLVKRINISNGSYTTLLDLSALKNFTINDGGEWPQGGLMGLALHPNLYSSDAAVRAAKPWVYLAYVYNRPTGQNCSTSSNPSNACYFATRIVRYDYTGNSLVNPVIMLDNMPGSNDHNSGRMKIGPDLKLYYTIGDMGAGQFNNSSRPNNAQNIDVLEGKCLRLNTESDNDAGADAWVPNDNPYYNGAPITPRDYVFTMGHRNAQGLVWAHINGTDELYNAEHGDKSDDEVNLLEAGKNYGWNRVSGFCDGNYNGMTLGGYSPVNENSFCSATPDYRNPLFTMFTATQSQINALSTDNKTWPTVAPSSIDFYSHTIIPNWQNSLLVTCLKAGKVYRIRLGADNQTLLPLGNGLDTASYFSGEGRFRDLAISPDGMKIYLACDASGLTSGPTGSFNGGGTPPPNAGSILEFSYLGPVLAIHDKPVAPKPMPALVRVFPNPATDQLHIVTGLTQSMMCHLQVYNSSGVLYRQLKVLKQETTIDVHEWPADIYLVQLFTTSGACIYTGRISHL